MDQTCLQVARNISEVTLAGVNSLPAETCSSHLPAFILAFAQSELMQNPGHEADARALHVLAWFLSGGVPVTPLDVK